MIAAAEAGDEENVRSILNHYSNIVASAVDTESDAESIDIVYRIDIHSEEHIAQLCDYQNKVISAIVRNFRFLLITPQTNHPCVF